MGKLKQIQARIDEPWYGHKFKEMSQGYWNCGCGKGLTESKVLSRLELAAANDFRQALLGLVESNRANLATEAERVAFGKMQAVDQLEHLLGNVPDDSWWPKLSSKYADEADSFKRLPMHLKIIFLKPFFKKLS